MGASPDARICFGVEFEEGEELWPGQYTDEDGEVKLDEYLALRSGGVNPYSEIPEDINSGSYDEYEAWQAANPEWTAKREAWWDLKKRLADEAPIEILHGGDSMSGYTWPILAVSGTHKYAYGYSVEKVEPGHLCATDIDIAAVIRWCEEHDIKAPPAEEWAWIMWATYG